MNKCFSTKDVIEHLEINFFSLIFSFLFSVNIVIKTEYSVNQHIDNQRVEIHRFLLQHVFFAYFDFDYLCKTMKIILPQPSFVVTAALNLDSESDFFIGEENKNET